jgi:alkylated DNA repair dioxygenase AlkB
MTIALPPVLGELRRRAVIEPLRQDPRSVPGRPLGLDADEAQEVIPGLSLIPGFLSEAEEEAILAEIDRQPWSDELQRRVQHYGWRYDYQSRRVDPSMRIGPLPEWATRVARSLFDSGHVPELPDQVIVNEYVENQGIAPHIDSPSSFADGVAMVSLLETWEMVFRRRGRKGTGEGVRLERRSATILTGEARYEWTHAVPARKTEPGAIKLGRKTRVPRGRRISLTFRKVIADRHGP